MLSFSIGRMPFFSGSRGSRPIRLCMNVAMKGRLPPTDGEVAADPTGSQSPARRQRIMDLPPGLAEFIPAYLASRRDELKKMIGLLAASDFDSLAVLGHNIKGSGASFGFPEISRIGVALQDSAEQSDTVATGALLRELEHYLDYA